MPEHCLIVEPLRLVAQDLAVTLQELTGCKPLIASSIPTAVMHLGTLDPSERLSLAFVYVDVGTFTNSPLKPLLEGRGARVVLTAPDPGWGPIAVPFPILRRPFVTADVHEVLRSLG
jgi:hypothetical protein